MPAVAATAFNPFIVSTNVNKADPKTRKLIRSHVMLGKNRGKRKAGSVKVQQRRVGVEAESSHSSSASSDEETRVVAVPPKVGGDYSFIKLAAEVEPFLVQQVLKFTHSSKEALFPLEPCIAFNKKQKKWVEPLTWDKVYCHAILFAAQAAFGFGSSKDTNGSTASQHFGKTVKLLRLRLEQDDRTVTTSDTTLMVIMVLAMSALMSGQEETARSHLVGVKRIVEIRGGFSSFSDNVKLLIEILRCDIGLTLSMGLPPLFFHRPFAGAPIPQPTSRKPPSKSEGFEMLLPSLDSGLVYIWHSLRQFCKTVNTASKTNRRLPEQMLLDSMASAVYPLLNMRFETGTVSETCRLGLLAFCSNVFLQWQGMNLNYHSLPSMYRQSLLDLARSSSPMPSQAMLWLLMIGGIALFTGEEDRSWLLLWLQETFDESAVLSWEDAQDVGKTFLWVDFIHDRPGQRFYAAVAERDVPWSRSRIDEASSHSCRLFRGP